jgi:hypothetical protein
MQNWKFVLVFLFGFMTRAAVAGQLPLGSNPSPQKYAEVYADDTERPAAPAVATSGNYSSYSASASSDSEPNYMRVSLTPLIGYSMWSGRWGQQIYNNYTFGLALEVPIVPIFSVEVEGGTQQNTINYLAPLPYQRFQNLHTFSQYSLGANGKLYIIRHKIFNPYVGAGLAALYYDGLRSGVYPMNMFPYGTWVGAGKLMVGLDVNIVEHVSLGVRGAYVVPLFHQAPTAYNAYQSSPATADNSAIDSSYWQAMGALKVTF